MGMFTHLRGGGGGGGGGVGTVSLYARERAHKSLYERRLTNSRPVGNFIAPEIVPLSMRVRLRLRFHASPIRLHKYRLSLSLPCLKQQRTIVG